MKRLIFILPMALSILMGCKDNKVYDSYDHTLLTGWDRADELSYDVPPVRTAGRYVTTLGVRITDDYPFQSLTLIVEQKVYHRLNPVVSKNKFVKPKAVKAKFKTDNYTDTINCVLFDTKGKIKGHGINHYQYRYRVSEQPLSANDSLHVTIRHDMRREIMPGVSDIGISLARQ